MSGRLFVIGDVHGQIGLLKGLLLKAGLLAGDGETGYRRLLPDSEVICVGDLIQGNAYMREPDRATLVRAQEWLDGSLVGNHELGFLGGPRFNSQWDDQAGSLARVLGLLCEDGFYTAARAEAGTLICHAGLSIYFSYETATEAAAAIETAFVAERAGLLISGIGKERGGRDPVGGICWLNWEDERNPRFNQLVGHTPCHGDVVTAAGTGHLNIDVGGKFGLRLAGVFLEDGRVVETVVYERPYDEDDLDYEEIYGANRDGWEALEARAGIARVGEDHELAETFH